MPDQTGQSKQSSERSENERRPTRHYGQRDELSALPPFLGPIIDKAGEQALISLLTLDTDVDRSTRILDRRRAEVAEDQKALVDAVIRRSLTLNPDETLTPEHLLRVSRIDLSYEPVTNSGLAHLSDLKELKELHLVGTRVDSEGLRHLSDLVSLRFLYLRDTGVGDAGLKYLSSLTELKHLDFSYTQVGDTGMKYLSGLKLLTLMDLRGTRVGDAGLVHLSGLESLEWLFIDHTKFSNDQKYFSDAGVKKLQEALPDCHIR